MVNINKFDAPTHVPTSQLQSYVTILCLLVGPSLCVTRLAVSWSKLVCDVACSGSLYTMILLVLRGLLRFSIHNDSSSFTWLAQVLYTQ